MFKQTLQQIMFKPNQLNIDLVLSPLSKRLLVGTALGLVTFALSGGFLFSNQAMATTLTSTTTFSAYDAANNDLFGSAVATYNGSMLIGAKQDDTYRGSVYLYKNSNPSQVTKLTAPSRANYDMFGSAVAINDQYILVGSQARDRVINGKTNADVGAAYIYNLNGTLQRTLSPSDAKASLFFGYSTALYGNYALVGANNDPTLGYKVGSAYLFNASTGQQLYKFNPNPANGNAILDRFGSAVALNDKYALIGAFSRTSSVNNASFAGGAYLFDLNTKQQLSLFEGSAQSDYFGSSVALYNNLAIVGAQGVNSKSGAVYAYEILTDALGNFSGTQLKWSFQGLVGDELGVSLSVNSNYVLAGAPGTNNSQGSSYLLDLNTGALIEQLLGPTTGSKYGTSLALADNQALIGASGFNNNRGTSYLYDVAPPQNNLVAASFTASEATPEPLTILGAGTAIGFGAFFKRKLAKSQKDDNSSENA